MNSLNRSLTPAPADQANTEAPTPIRFDTKVAVLLEESLPGWQRLNVTAFLTSGITGANPSLVGEPYVDADKVAYLPMLGQPVLVFAGTAEVLKAAHAKALQRELPMAIFTADLFATGNDRDNRAAVRRVGTADLELVGLAVHGAKNAVDKVLKGSHLHP